MYKLMAVDIDGTLLNNEKTISQENYEAIQNARRKGVKIVLATGRPPKGIEKYLAELNLKTENEYAILCNGALVQNTNNGVIVTKTQMQISDIKYLLLISKKLNVTISAFTSENIIIAHALSKYNLTLARLNGISHYVVDFNNLDKSIKVFTIIFVDEDYNIMKDFNKLPKEVFEKYSVVRGATFSLEFSYKSVSKGAGVTALAHNLKIDMKDVICVGDAGNDISMIKYAGLGVAMGNAFPEVKKIANYITKSNEQNGVAHVINKFILNKEIDV